MMLWKSLTPRTIVDACLVASQRRAEKSRDAEADAGAPSANKPSDRATGTGAAEAIQAAE